MPDTLYLHAGHSKTGSSYIQSMLAGSAGSLLAHRIYYPLPKSADKAAAGGISSGNGSIFLDSAPEMCKIPNSAKSVFFSYELLYNEILQSNRKNIIRKWRDIHSIETLKVLLIIRNPIEHFASVYQQAIKRGGFTGSINEYASTYHVPIKIDRFLNYTSSIEGSSITVINYSYARNSLVSFISDWLNLNSGIFRLPKEKIINRSLTSSELLLQRALNKALGRSGGLLSDPLCEELPYIKPDLILPEIGVQEKLLTRLRPAMESVNAVVHPEHRYKFDLKPETHDMRQTYIFNQTQIEIIARNLGNEIKRLRDELDSIKKIT
jgi:hypothetical protein